MKHYIKDQIDWNADYILRAGDALKSISKLIIESDIADDQFSFVNQDARIGLLTAVGLIAEGLVERSCNLRQIGKGD